MFLFIFSSEKSGGRREVSRPAADAVCTSLKRLLKADVDRQEGRASREKVTVTGQVSRHNEDHKPQSSTRARAHEGSRTSARSTRVHTERKEGHDHRTSRPLLPASGREEGRGGEARGVAEPSRELERRKEKNKTKTKRSSSRPSGRHAALTTTKPRVEQKRRGGAMRGKTKAGEDEC